MAQRLYLGTKAAPWKILAADDQRIVRWRLTDGWVNIQVIKFDENGTNASAKVVGLTDAELAELNFLVKGERATLSAAAENHGNK